jgi:23S rRNA pseudouridine2605 synthase/16S rRNA pseudouridine516 synthase
MQERLQKIISRSGITSRRHAEGLILSGKVKVNGKSITKLGSKADINVDKIEVDGKIIQKPQKFIYLALNKPKRYITTRFDPQRRHTVYELLPEDLKNVVWPVGRLDFNTEGLLILTNDGELTQILTHPSKEHEKEYLVELDKEISEGKLEKIENGVFIDGRKTSKTEAVATGKIVRLIVHEGWNRQIRKMFAVLGYSVINLRRVRVSKLKLGNIELGTYQKIKKNDLI